MKKLQLKQHPVQKVKLTAKFALVGSAFSIIGAIVFFSFFGTQMGTPKIAEAAVIIYTTRTNGNWTSTLNVWSTNGGTTACSCAPSASVSANSIVINHTITMNTDVTVSSGGSINISKTGSLTSVTNKLEIQNATLVSYGTISVTELRILSTGSGLFYGPLTGVTRLRFEGTATFDALTTVTAGDLELKSGSVNKVSDGWQVSLTIGDLVNEGTLTFDGNILTILSGDFVNALGGVIAGFGNIETKIGTISNSGTWDANVDICSNGIISGITDPENCLKLVAALPTCDNQYSLDWSNASTFTVTCGTLGGGKWTVEGMTCWYYSPVFMVGGSVGGPNRMAEWSVRMNGTGNLDNNDTAFVYYYVNGVLARTDSYLGDVQAAVFTSSRRILVPSGGNYQVRIKFINDKSGEKWWIWGGDVTGCLLSILPPPSPLPVTLSAFKAEAVNNRYADLSWTTIAELNNDYFTIERSADGKQFSELTRVAGNGTTTAIHKYSYTDEHPYRGTSYYRLKQTDFNGKTETFKTVSVTIKETLNEVIAIRVSPNPFIESFIAEFESSAKEEAQVQILNANGTIIYTEKITTEEGSNLYRFSKPLSVKSGTYVLRVTNGTSVLASAKIIKN